MDAAAVLLLEFAGTTGRLGAAAAGHRLYSPGEGIYGVGSFGLGGAQEELLQHGVGSLPSLTMLYRTCVMGSSTPTRRDRSTRASVVYTPSASLWKGLPWMKSSPKRRLLLWAEKEGRFVIA